MRSTTGKGDDQLIPEFLDAILSVKTGTEVIKSQGTLHASRHTYEELDMMSVGGIGITDLDLVQKSLKFPTDLGDTWNDFINKQFQDVKEGIFNAAFFPYDVPYESEIPPPPLPPRPPQE